jgi:RNA polymerase sigma-70 factor (ECF subfamily)
MPASLVSLRSLNDDVRLVERCLTGDHAAERELFRAHRKRVHATLYRILGSNASMDDLIQDAFLNVFRSLRTYRGEASLGTWIDRCTVRVAYAYISQRRKARPVQLELVHDAPSGDATAEQRAIAREAARHLYDALDKMDPKLRLSFTLHAIDGRPLSEVAALMDASLVATKTRVWRARRELAGRARRDPVLAGFLPAVESSDAGIA